jgi:hypothetical protein
MSPISPVPTLTTHTPTRAPCRGDSRAKRLRWILGVLTLAAGCGPSSYSRPDDHPDARSDVDGATGSGGSSGSGGKGGSGGTGAISGSGGFATAGTSGSGGRGGTGLAGTGGSGAAGSSGTGGRGSGGVATGGLGTGGRGTGGVVTGTGGQSTGGAGTGGMGTGGAGTGGAGTGGAGTGGAGTGGAGTGGAGTGGAGTGGAASVDVAQYNFESSTQSWTAAAGSAPINNIGRSTLQHFAGIAALAATIATPSVMTQIVEVAPPTPAIPAGAVVTFHVYVPTAAAVSSLQPYVLESTSFRFTGKSTPAASLVRNGWTTITLTVPSDAMPILRLGVQILSSGAWTDTIYVDSISW